MYTDPEQKSKAELLDVIHFLSNLVMCRHKILQDYISAQVSKEEYSSFKTELREVIEEKIIEIFYPGGIDSDYEISESDIDLLGEMIE